MAGLLRAALLLAVSEACATENCLAPDSEYVVMLQHSERLTDSHSEIQHDDVKDAEEEMEEEVEEEVEDEDCNGGHRTPPKLMNIAGAWGNWAAIPLEPKVQRPKPKPAFLMMIYARIAFEKAWKTLFENSDSESFRLVIHAKATAQIGEFFLPYVMKEKVASDWCENGNLMLKMMEVGLEDPDATHFIFVSGDTMPLKTLDYMVRDIQASPASRMCIDSQWMRAENWFALERKHASLLAKHTTELWGLRSGDALGCEDENLFYWPLAARDEKVADRCMMFADWSGTGKSWSKGATSCNCQAFLSSNKTKASCAHPSAYMDVSKAGLDALLGSSAGFWFARKFLGDGQNQGASTYEGTTLLADEIANRLKEMKQSETSRMEPW